MAAQNNMRDLNKMPVLTGAQNYREWSNTVITFLLRESAWTVIEGALTKPSKPSINRDIRSISSTEDIAAAEEKAQKEYKIEFDKWSSVNYKALGAIRSGLSAGILEDVGDIFDAKVVWDFLKKKYYVSASVQSFEGIRAAMDTHYDNCSGVQDYIHKMTAGITKSKRVLRKNEAWPETATIQFLFANLGDTWDVFLTSYLTSKYDIEITTVDDVCQVLIQEEMRMKFKDSGTTSLARAQRGRKQYQPNSKDDKNANDSQKPENKPKDRDIVCPIARKMVTRSRSVGSCIRN
jgi:hypothetical protein